MSQEALPPPTIISALKQAKWYSQRFASCKSISSIQNSVDSLKLDLDKLADSEQTVRTAMYALQAKNERLSLDAELHRLKTQETETALRRELFEVKGAHTAAIEANYHKALQDVREDVSSKMSSVADQTHTLQDALAKCQRQLQTIQDQARQDQSPRLPEVAPPASPSVFEEAPETQAIRRESDSRRRSSSTQSGSSEVVPPGQSPPALPPRSQKRAWSAAPSDDPKIARAQKRLTMQEDIKRDTQDRPIPSSAAATASSNHERAIQSHAPTGPSARVEWPAAPRSTAQPPAVLTNCDADTDEQSSPLQPPETTSKSKKSKKKKSARPSRSRNRTRTRTPAASRSTKADMAAGCTAAVAAVESSEQAAAVAEAQPRRSGRRRKSTISYRESDLARLAVVGD